MYWWKGCPENKGCRESVSHLVKKRLKSHILFLIAYDIKYLNYFFSLKQNPRSYCESWCCRMSGKIVVMNFVPLLHQITFVVSNYVYKWWLTVGIERPVILFDMFHIFLCYRWTRPVTVVHLPVIKKTKLKRETLPKNGPHPRYANQCYQLSI